MKCLFLILLFNFTGSLLASQARSVYLSDKRTENVTIVPGRSTILSFPSHPMKVILGNQGLFAIEYVENDIAIAAIKAPARSNLFVYLEGRRFGFDLKTAPDKGDELVLVRDSEDRKVKVKIKND